MSGGTTIVVVENEFARALTDSTVTVAEVTGATPLSANTDFDAAASDDPNRFYAIEEDNFAIRHTYSSPANIYGAYLANHNLDPFNAAPATKGTMRLEGTNNPADFGTGSAPFDTGIVQVNDGLVPLFNRNAFLLGQLLAFPPPPTTYTYWQVTVENTADKPIWVGELWLTRKVFFFPIPVEVFTKDGQLDLTHGIDALDVIPADAVDRFLSDFGQSWNYLVREGSLSLPVSNQSLASVFNLGVADLDPATAFARVFGRRPLIYIPYSDNSVPAYAFFVRLAGAEFEFSITGSRTFQGDQTTFVQPTLTRPYNFR